MKKILSMVWLVVLVVLLTACGKGEADIQPEAEITDSVGSADDIAETEIETKNEKKIEKSKNKGIFPADAKLVPIPSGMNIDGVATHMLDVLLPADADVIGSGFDADGYYTNTKYSDTTVCAERLIEKIKAVDKEELEYLTYIMINSDGFYSTHIYNTSDFSVDLAKKNYPGGIDITKDPLHPAYAVLTDGDEKTLMLVIDIDEDWSVQAASVDETVLDRLSVEDFGNGFYELIKFAE